MEIKNPFWLLHSFLMRVTNQVVWRVCEHSVKKVVLLTMFVAALGLTLLSIGALLETGSWTALIVPSLLIVLVFMPGIRRDYEDGYRKNTANGCQNAVQEMWGFMVSLNIVMALGVLATVTTSGSVGASTMMIGVYCILVLCPYILAADRPPENYSASSEKFALAW